jgi:hypothetical protein
MSVINTKFKVIFFFYAVLALAISVLLTLATNTIDLYRLANDGEIKSGVVAQQSCDDHMSFIYNFSVDGVEHKGKVTSEDCHKIMKGDKVAVHYLSTDPNINTAIDPKNAFKNNAIAILMASLGLSALITTIFWFRYRRRAIGRQNAHRV